MITKISFIKLILVVLLAVWCFGIFFHVFFHDSLSYALPGAFINKIYSLVCHRDASKTLSFSGYKLEVCARCTGIYLGALAFSIPGLIFSKLRLHTKKYIFMSLGLMLTDILLYSSGIYHYSKWTAFITGIVLGSVCILYIFESIEEYFSEAEIFPDVQ